MRSSIRLFTIAGIEVGIHPTWFIAFALIAWTFATGLLPRQSPGWTTTEYWIAGAAASGLLFLSVLVHELAHSFTARVLGLPVHGITLFLFGGVSRIGGEIRNARTEFLVAFAGPASSLAIGGVCVVSVMGLDPGPGPEPLGVGIVSALGYMNLFLGAFNLLPGHPLDGGRVLRAIVWGATGNAPFAGRIAAVSGRAVALGLGALGAVWLFQGDSLGGLWMIFLAMFLLGSASQENRLESAARGSGASVAAAVVSTPQTVDFGDTLDLVARKYLEEGSQAAVCVTRSRELIGFIEPRDLQRFDEADWPNITVGQLIGSRGFVIADARDSAATVLQRLSMGGHTVVAVFDGPSFLGVATLDSLAAVIGRTRPGS